MKLFIAMLSYTILMFFGVELNNSEESKKTDTYLTDEQKQEIMLEVEAVKDDLTPRTESRIETWDEEDEEPSVN